MGYPAKKNPVLVIYQVEEKFDRWKTFFLFAFVCVIRACLEFMFVFLLYVIASLPDSFSPGPDLGSLMKDCYLPPMSLVFLSYSLCCGLDMS